MKKKPKRYNTVAAMINDLSGPNSKTAREFRKNLKKKKHEINRLLQSR